MALNAREQGISTPRTRRSPDVPSVSRIAERKHKKGRYYPPIDNFVIDAPPQVKDALTESTSALPDKKKSTSRTGTIYKKSA